MDEPQGKNLVKHLACIHPFRPSRRDGTFVGLAKPVLSGPNEAEPIIKPMT